MLKANLKSFAEETLISQLPCYCRRYHIYEINNIAKLPKFSPFAGGCELNTEISNEQITKFKEINIYIYVFFQNYIIY